MEFAADRRRRTNPLSRFYPVLESKTKRLLSRSLGAGLFLMALGAGCTRQPPVVTLLVEIAGSGNGTVVLNDDLRCSEQSCVFELPSHLMLTIRAMPEPSSDFVGWSGDCSG